MTDRNKHQISPFVLRSADTLASKVSELVLSGKLDARSPVADALLEYATTRFGSHDPIGDLRKHAEEQDGRPKT